MSWLFFSYEYYKCFKVPNLVLCLDSLHYAEHIIVYIVGANLSIS